MSRVIFALIFLSIIFGALSGRMGEVSLAVVSGASSAVTLLISIAGSLCLWSALMEVMKRSGLSARLSRLLQPVIRFLFKKDAEDEQARDAIAQNMAANLLGLGNAATPAGLRAAERLNELAKKRGEPPNNVFLLIVINTASLQIIPTTIAAIRASFGSSSPYGILLEVWLASICSVSVGILAAKFFSKV